MKTHELLLSLLFFIPGIASAVNPDEGQWKQTQNDNTPTIGGNVKTQSNSLEYANIFGVVLGQILYEGTETASGNTVNLRTNVHCWYNGQGSLASSNAARGGISQMRKWEWVGDAPIKDRDIAVACSGGGSGSIEITLAQSSADDNGSASISGDISCVGNVGGEELCKVVTTGPRSVAASCNPSKTQQNNISITGSIDASKGASASGSYTGATTITSPPKTATYTLAYALTGSSTKNTNGVKAYTTNVSILGAANSASGSSGSSIPFVNGGDSTATAAITLTLNLSP